MNMTCYPAWVDGRMIAPGEPAISPLDQGFTLGLAVFETLLFEDGWRYFEAAHLARLQKGARRTGIAWPPPIAPERALSEYCSALDVRACALRMTLTRGVLGGTPTMVVSGRTLEPAPASGVELELAKVPQIASEASLETIKTTNRLRNLMAREHALSSGAFDALFCNAEGDVAEGTIANLFVVRDGKLLTPSTERGCLPGIMRGIVLEEARAERLDVLEDRVELDDLRGASEVFLTNTTGRLIPVCAVRGLVEGLPGPAGEVLTQLALRVSERERLDRASGA